MSDNFFEQRRSTPESRVTKTRSVIVAIGVLGGLSFTSCTPERILQFGSGGPDSLSSTAVDGRGNVYIAGSVSGALSGQVSAGGGDAFVRKYDGAGNELWTRQFGSAGGDVASSVSVDSTGNVYVAGFAADALPDQTNEGKWDIFVRAFDGSGNLLWTHEFGSDGYDFGSAVGVDDQGNVYVSGMTENGLPGQPPVPRIDGVGSSAAFARKYDRFGSELWTLQFLPSSGQLLSASATIDGAGDLYFHGSIDGTLPGQTSAGGPDAYVRKYDRSGNELWTRQFGSNATDNATSLAVDRSGSVYTAGVSHGALPGQSSVGGPDAFVRKYDASGSESWTRQFGTAGVDAATAVTIGSTGIVYVGGNTTGTLPGQSSAGSTDAFVRKYDGTGAEIGTRQFGTAGIDQGISLSVDDSTLYVAGETNGAFPGQLNPNAGEFDPFLASFNP